MNIVQGTKEKQKYLLIGILTGGIKDAMGKGIHRTKESFWKLKMFIKILQKCYKRNGRYSWGISQRVEQMAKHRVEISRRVIKI